MGNTYSKKAGEIHFTPMVYTMYGKVDYIQPYNRGLDNAKVFLESTIEELELWGYAGENAGKKVKAQDNKDGVVLNLSITQQQSQQITQSINLSQYDKEVQDKVQELLDELKKETKSKVKISNLIKWLADKGVDALIAILLASANLA